MVWVCDKDPEVAVTATDEEKEWKLEPQPFAKQRTSAKARSMKMPRRLPRRRKPGRRRERASASVPPETAFIAVPLGEAAPATLMVREL